MGEVRVEQYSTRRDRCIRAPTPLFSDMRFPTAASRITIAVAVVLGACRDATAPRSLPEPILAISTDSVAGVPQLRLTIATPTRVQVDYWQDSSYVLRVQDAVTTDDNIVALPRVAE